MIPLDEPVVGDREIETLTDCIRSGWLSWQGPYVAELERLAARYAGVEHAVSVSSGTSALLLAVRALGIGPGAEVIVPTLTFSACIWAITLHGAVPVFADCTPGRFEIDPAAVAARITPRTRAVLAVHLYGYPADMDAIVALAHRHGCAVIEDAAQAFGARYKDRPVGSLADVACLSFHNKLMATGEGGMVLTSDAGLVRRVAELRAPSPDNRAADRAVLNHRLSNLAAAVGVAQIERLDAVVTAKRALAAAYTEALAGSSLATVPELDGRRGAWWRCPVLTSPHTPVSRDRLIARLAERGIAARGVFHPMHRHPACEDRTPFPHADDLSARGLEVPSSARLTPDDARRIAHVLRAAADG